MKEKELKFVISLPLLTLALLLVPASHAQSSVTTVTISGLVSNPDPAIGSVTVRGFATGSASSLAGDGTDSPPFAGVSGNPGVCQFPLTGFLKADGHVTLSGTVTQSSNPAFIGIPVKVLADASTGAITFVFGPFTFTGTGTVAIRTA